MALEGKRPLGRTSCRYEDIIEMDLTDVGWEDMDWNNWLRIGTGRESRCERGNETSVSVKYGEVLD
jgi:hypothetical protein